MGIIWLVKDFDALLKSTYIVVWHAIGLFYLWQIHLKIFKPEPTRTKALALTLIGIGFGQVYNLQLKKGLFFASLTPLSIALVMLGITEKGGTTVLTLGVLTLLSFVDAIMSASSTKNRILDHALQGKVDKIVQYQTDGFEFVVDTNILMHESELLIHLLVEESFELTICMIVFNELEDLKKNDKLATRKQAQVAFDIIEDYQHKDLLTILEEPAFEILKGYGLGWSPDDKMIGTYLNEFKNSRPTIMFLSNDKGARIIARNVGLPVANM